MKSGELTAYCCRRCGREAARTDGFVLAIYGQRVPLELESLTLRCPGCGCLVKWQRVARDGGQVVSDEANKRPTRSKKPERDTMPTPTRKKPPHAKERKMRRYSASTKK